MIFVLKSDVQASAQKAAQLVSQQTELFKAIGFAALRARASMMEPGKVIKFGSFEFVVDEDEFGEWVVVQIILPRKEIEVLGKAKAEELGMDIESLDGAERNRWLGDFLDRLKELLKKWQDIKCHVGPGENLTFEKSSYRKGSKDWR
jgi:hypothetical protein